MIELLKAGSSKTVKAVGNNCLVAVVQCDKNFKLSGTGKTRGIAYEDAEIEVENPHSKTDILGKAKISFNVTANDDEAIARRKEKMNS